MAITHRMSFYFSGCRLGGPNFDHAHLYESHAFTYNWIPRLALVDFVKPALPLGRFVVVFTPISSYLYSDPNRARRRDLPDTDNFFHALVLPSRLGLLLRSIAARRFSTDATKKSAVSHASESKSML